ncbi:MAG: DNA alkylation repair protein [Melioribacteraceae bacterium]|nr:DNA alkylation repair protein [Melioribacteraceae bacterium]MCF8264495.1 DNA alkylation repair protein [Melioribacteraceae bacterium]MCF8411918.1 DNA alkylation repair protein [Melioribacteraceae bacterium]MCF8430947.1 DNA alkylation repair protein [Melioribacteraceae bacterium]
MPEPFKNLITRKVVTEFAEEINSVFPKFEIEKFLSSVFDLNWENEELKQRFRHLTISTFNALDLPYKEAIKILMEVPHNKSTWTSFVYPDFVEFYGVDYYKESIPALELFTQRSSSEFAVRPFIVKYPDKMMKQMLKWSKHKNHHVRRLSSEGCRPRLPWAMALPQFKKDPAPIIPILENLKDDESEYVRKSVANNLNDITKDNPDLVLSLAKDWLGKSGNTDKILKHGLRTLLKKGNPEALELFGIANNANLEVLNLSLSPQSVKIGNKMKFSFNLISQESKPIQVRLEYKIHFMNKSGNYSVRIFKISESNINAAEKKEVTRNQNFADLTIRKHYPGKHKLEIVVNGITKAVQEFEVVR